MAIRLLSRRDKQDKTAVFDQTEPKPHGTRRQRLRAMLRVAAFVYLSATIVVLASERVYWYWTGFGADSVLFLGAFYLIPLMAGLWALALAPARRIRHVIFAGAIFAFSVEGVLTPIIYLDGPLALMAAMFVGWHGLIAFTGFWYLIRRWLLERKTKLLALVSAVFGAVWGVWAVTSAVSDQLEDEDVTELGFVPTLLEPAEFAVYATAVVATLALAHWLIGFVWPTGWKPGKKSTVAVFVISGLYMSVAVLPAIFWAPLKLAVLIGGTWKLMRRPDPQTLDSPPTILDQLAGRVRLRDVALLLPMAVAAAVAYAVTWQFKDTDAFATRIYVGLVAIQIIGGGAAFIWAWRQARRASIPASHPTPATTSTFPSPGDEPTPSIAGLGSSQSECCGG